MKIRTYSELSRFHTFEQRFEYLSLEGVVGQSTFGFDRWVNQQFYRSRLWRDTRDIVLVRDEGCDLGILGREVHSAPLIHHMNPVTREAIEAGEDWIIDPEYLVTTCHRTHNAIHYGDERLLPKLPMARRHGDTKLW